VLLDDEYTDPVNADKYDLEFIKIIRTLSEKKVSSNEFFEEDLIVQSICKKILEKIVRNFVGLVEDEIEFIN
jgi:hypothetical protein